MNYFSSAEKSIENSINDELAKVNDWLKINKLLLNINKTKFMIFHHYQQQITLPNIFIDNVAIECVQTLISWGFILINTCHENHIFLIYLIL